ncbi:flagellar motor switch protein FliN/FliY [Massilia sp. PDC64]|jgi:flagellar motor switch protein FliN/FliY|nr:flagellar motor switch protein FliN [Massilia sp. PDC64]SDF63700.1 flagellar motor switch protein FliN/FliY [Massilia sp. PDC64]
MTLQTQIIELSDFQHPPADGPAVLGGNLRLLDKVPVTLSVAVGQVETTVGELLALQEASVLKIDRRADTPIDVILNGQVIARGQLVAVDDNFGIRITEVAAQKA